MKKAMHFIGAVLLGVACFLWLDFLILSGTIYAFVMTKMGVSDTTISYSIMALVAL